jgi:hypothetical protein
VFVVAGIYFKLFRSSQISRSLKFNTQCPGILSPGLAHAFQAVQITPNQPLVKCCLTQ